MEMGSTGTVRNAHSSEPNHIDEFGTKFWHKDGELNTFHRDDDLPAIITKEGDQFWWKHGKQHRGDDKPAIVYEDGAKEWLEHGKHHRLNGRPALDYSDGYQEWWVNGKRHRLDGPAILWQTGDGPPVEQWWVYGIASLNDTPASLLAEASSETSSTSTLSVLSQHKDFVVSAMAANNSNCPLEVKIEWALTRGEGLGE